MLVQYFDVQPFIASLAGLFLARGLAFVVSLESIRVEDPVVLWLQRTRFNVGGWYITPTGIIALLVGGDRRLRAAVDPLRPDRSTRSAAASSRRGSWA